MLFEMEQLSMILALSVYHPYLISQIFIEMYNLVWEHSTEKRQSSDSSLRPVLSSALHWEPLSTILAFSVNDPLRDLPNIPGNG